MRERKDFWLEKLGEHDVFSERRKNIIFRVGGGQALHKFHLGWVW